ncbi:MAG: Gfo/Idh/MocA family oxidoreductase [Flammeovirgaceae bacterium]|nr:Gfo/Idh/MocA family oxidoreductase [Flammeovirgaceae bacterium]
MEKGKDTSKSRTRRDFIKSTGAAALATPFVFNIGMAQGLDNTNVDTLKIGLIGCGGRGTGAANQALSADDNVILTAVGDVFPDKMEASITNLQQIHKDKVKIDNDHKFLGFDSYKKVLESDVDVVLLATPPAFRPGHLSAAIAAGKHVFCEKPMAVDVPGLKKVYAAAKAAKEKNLSLVSGFCWRYHFPKRETFGKVLNGDIGEVMSVYNTYNTGELWSRPRQPEWSEMEFKMRNWLYFNWLSGDHITEQAIHSIDMMSWAMGDVLPVKVTGTGGRQQRIDPKYGHVYDHFAIVYEYESGAKGFHFSRQQKNCTNSYAVDINGTKGNCMVDCIKRKHEIVSGGEKWRYRGEGNDMYQTEHNELFASIRSGKHMNDGEWMANSTMLAIIGRMAAYSGQTITWEEAMKSEEVLGPPMGDYSWDLDWPTKTPAVPGEYKLF